MEFTKLGNSGIEISRFCLGCMSFGDPASKMHAWTLNPEDSEKIIKHALDLGINASGNVAAGQLQLCDDLFLRQMRG